MSAIVEVGANCLTGKWGFAACRCAVDITDGHSLANIGFLANFTAIDIVANAYADCLACAIHLIACGLELHLLTIIQRDFFFAAVHDAGRDASAF